MANGSEMVDGSIVSHVANGDNFTTSDNAIDGCDKVVIRLVLAIANLHVLEDFQQYVKNLRVGSVGCSKLFRNCNQAFTQFGETVSGNVVLEDFLDNNLVIILLGRRRFI